MSTGLLEETQSETQDETLVAAAQELQSLVGAVSLSFTWFGVERMLSDDQKAQAANLFDADKNLMSAHKKLIDTSHPSYRACTKIRSQASLYWRGMTMPYPQKGIRLIKQADVSAFDAKMTDFQAQLEKAVEGLSAQYEAIKETAREQLGDLFNPADYPSSLEGQFAIRWSYPSIEPPEYLTQFNPKLYRQEQEKMQRRFEAAIQMAENEFCEQMTELVNHMLGLLQDNPDGTRKTFKTNTVENFQKFYDEFRKFNTRDNSQIERILGRAAAVMSGTDIGALRQNTDIRRHVAEQLQAVREQLGEVVVTAPRRKLRRVS